MPNEFDYHASIKRLAEAEWGCPDTKEFGIEHCKADLGSELYSHTLCGGSGRIAPFASLRVRCLGEDDGDGTRLCHLGKILAFAWVPRGEKNPYVTHDACDGRGWVPEPDVEKACWKLLSSTNWRYTELYRSGTNTWDCRLVDMNGRQSTANDCNTSLEAVVHAALAWLEEQHG